MQQLGAGFINSFLLNYIKKNILGNIENDARLIKLFKTQDPLNPSEKNELYISYFKAANNDFQYQMSYRKTFWNEFIEFVEMQKKICGENLTKLAFRMLPDAETGKFSKAAEDNIFKFSFRVCKVIEKDEIERLIALKETAGMSKEKVEKDKKDLADGKLILVRKKNGDFDYMKDEDIKRDIDNVKKRAEDLAEYLTKDDEEGTQLYGFNPLEPAAVENMEKSDTLTGLLKQAWANKAVMTEKTLESVGLHVEEKMTIDASGVARGFVEEKYQKGKTSERLYVEIDLEAPNPIYKFTFANKPSQVFYLTPDELNKYFKKEGSRAGDIYAQKKLLETKKTEKFAQKAPIFTAPWERMKHKFAEEMEEEMEKGAEERPLIPAKAEETIGAQAMQEAKTKTGEQAPFEAAVVGAAAGQKAVAHAEPAKRTTAAEAQAKYQAEWEQYLKQLQLRQQTQQESQTAAEGPGEKQKMNPIFKVLLGTSGAFGATIFGSLVNSIFF